MIADIATHIPVLESVPLQRNAALKPDISGSVQHIKVLLLDIERNELLRIVVGGEGGGGRGRGKGEGREREENEGG